MRPPAGLSVAARRVGRSAVALLGVGALAWMAVVLADAWPSLRERGARPGEVGALVGLALVHALALLLLAENWRIGSARVGAAAVPASVARRSFTDTQIAKYLPGNVLHLAARHGVMARAGMPHGPLLAALAFESAVLVLAAALVGALSLAFAWNTGALHPAGSVEALVAAIQTGLPAGPAAAAATAVGALAVLVAAAAAVTVARRRAGSILEAPLRPLLAAGLPCLLRAMIFFAVHGAVFAVILAGLDPSVPASVALAAGAFAWIAGYLAVGAPGGLGPREVVLVALLTGLATTVDTAVAVAAAGLFRVVTMLGDGLLLGIGRLAFRPGDGLEAPARR